MAALLWALSSAGGAFAEEEAPAAEAAAPPTAEESASEGGTGTPTEGVEEIVVTGVREYIDRQETPVSITAFTSEELQASRVQDIADLSDITTNLEIKTVFAASSPTLFIRGVGLQDYNANSAGAVAIYNDGVTINTPTGQLFSFFDVQSVEVYRGPQPVDSRNATAGAIKVWTSKPDGEFGANMNATYGNYNLIELEGAVGFPIAGEQLSGRISGRLNLRDGYVTNRCATRTTGICDLRFRTKIPEIPEGWTASPLNDKVNNLDNWAVRGQLRWQPGAWDWLLKVEGGQSQGDAAQYQGIGTNPSVPGTDTNGYIDRDGDPFAGDYNLQGLEKLDLFGASLRGSTEVAGVEFDSITGYFATRRNVTDNCDANPFNTIHCFWSNESWQVSQELQIASYVGERFELSGGAFFLYEQLDSSNVFDDQSPIRSDQEFEQTTISGALYASGGYELDRLLEGLRVEGGIRLNSEHKSFSITARTLAPSSGLFFAELNDTESKTWTEPTGEAILRYRFNDDVNIYAKYSRGFKAGHFNGGAVDSLQLVSPVEPEFINAVEAGIRSLWWDGSLRLNGSLFFYDYTDLQVFELENADAGNPIPQLLNADARVFGAEAEVELTPLEGLFASLNFGWLDAEFTDFVFTRTVGKQRRPGPGGGVDRILAPIDFTGNTLISAPRFTLIGVLEYELEFARFGLPDVGFLVPRFDFSFKDEVFFDGSGGLGAAANISNFEVPPSVRLPDPFPENVLSQEAYWLFNARLAYRTPDQRIEVAGWVRNLTDERYLVDAFDLSLGFSKVLQIWGMPRTYGVTLSLRW